LSAHFPAAPRPARRQRINTRTLRCVLAFGLGLTPVCLLLGITLAQAVSANGSAHGTAQLERSMRPASSPFLQVIYPISQSVTPRLSSLPHAGSQPVPVDKGPSQPHHPSSVRQRGKAPALVPGPDAAAQLAPGSSSMPAPIANIEGVESLDNVYPPDTEGDIGYDPGSGKKYYFQWVNLHYEVWDITNPLSPSVVIAPTAGNALWAVALPGTQCALHNDGDPIVLFDEQAHRWLMSQFAITASFHQCVAVSQSADPTGAWNVYDYQYADGSTYFNDYAKFGVWPDPVYNAYFMTVNQFDASGTATLGAGVAAFDRAALLAGAAAPAMLLINLNTVDNNFDRILPADLDGAPPPAGTPGIFLAVDDDVLKPSFGPDALRIWEYRPNWVNPFSSTFGIMGTPNYTLPVTSFDVLPCVSSGNPDCIPQSGTSQRLDSLGDRLMYRAAFRDFGASQALVVNHTVLADGADRAGVRWYELQRNPGSGVWSIHQQSTYAPADGLYRWMGSVAMDRQGDMALGFSGSSSSQYPSIRYAGRVVSDTLNLLSRSDVTLTAGSGAQTGAAARWGDYSMMGIDPQDGCTFWYTNEYLAVTTFAHWHTRIGSFRFPECGPLAVGSIAGTVMRSADSAPISGSQVVALDALGMGTYSGLSDAAGHYQILGIPTGSYTLTASAPAYRPKTLSGAVVNAGLTTTAYFSLTSLLQSDLALKLFDWPDPVYAASGLSYVLTVTNLGPDPITSTIMLVDALPAGVNINSASGSGWACGSLGGVVSCTLASLAVGSAPPVAIGVTTPPTAGLLFDSASVSTAASIDLNPFNNSASVSTTVLAKADISIAKNGPPTAAPGGLLVYTLTVTNIGPSPMGITTYTYTNSGNIVILDDAAAAPYPSTVLVGGLNPVLTATAGLYNFNHTYPKDVDVLLVGPHGQATYLLADPAGSQASSGVNLAFDDSAGSSIPCNDVPLVSGTYQPTDCPDTYGNDLFPLPAPLGPYSATLSVVRGTDPNGVWELFVRDDAAGDVGSIGGGWSLRLTTDLGGMVVTDTLPAGAVFVGATGAGWNCTANGGVVRCVAPGFQNGIAPNVIVTATAPLAPGVLTNTAVVGTSAYDPDLSNNAAVVTTTIRGMYLPLIWR
jgi:uncharacterized repeat protein (TIGR01451 family)